METAKEIRWNGISLIAEEDKDNRPFWFEIDGVDGRLDIPLDWGIHVDTENMRWTRDDCAYPTLNDMDNPRDAVRMCVPYRQCDVGYRNTAEKTRADFLAKRMAAIMRKFRRQGFNVTEEALEHNFQAWLVGAKSGYRDDENGYHLFTPCGCNPLSFRASELHKTAEDWQRTYIA